MTPRRSAGAWVVALAALLAGCGGAEGPREPGADQPDAPAAPPATAEAPPAPGATGGPDAAGGSTPADRPSGPDSLWTMGTRTRASTVSEAVALLAAVRTGAHEGYERMSLELGGGGTGFPAYTISYIDRPLHECGSGRQVQPIGDAWLEIRLEPLDAHTQEGQPTIPHTPQDLAGMRNLQRLYVTCDFEAVVTLVLAMDEPNRFRAFTLESPRRIVVDVELEGGAR